MGQVVNIYEKALSFIKIRHHHSKELSRKLLMRGYSRLEIDETIEKLRRDGLLDDQQFGQMYLESLIKYKTFGYYGLKAKLMTRGLASNEAENLLRENLSLDAEKEIAKKLIEKDKGGDNMKLAGKLSRKGFRSEVVSWFLSNNMV
jgi:SOS response regulatory protein OraA/RecX